MGGGSDCITVSCPTPSLFDVHLLTVGEASVLFTGYAKAVRDIYLFTAKIPLSLLDFFERPKSILPTYDPILVSCVSIPIEPRNSLRGRLVTTMSLEAPDQHALADSANALYLHA